MQRNIKGNPHEETLANSNLKRHLENCHADVFKAYTDSVANKKLLDALVEQDKDAFSKSYIRQRNAALNNE